MKINFTIYSLFLSGLIILLLTYCKKEAVKTVPVVTITAVTDITGTTAVSGGEVTADGGAAVTVSGVCWSINQNPTIADFKTVSGSGNGQFTSNLTGLTPGTTYHIKAYATNAIGTGYSNQTTFSTLALAPVLSTIDLTAITSTTASCGGNITSDGGSAITARGVCWNTSQNPTIDNSKTTNGTGTGSFTSEISGLSPGVIFYVRAYASNSIGTTYGNQVTSVASAILPTLTTAVVSPVTTSIGHTGGNITQDGGAPVTVRGVCWSTENNPTTTNNKTMDGTGAGSFQSSLTGLSVNTTYYARAYATNSIGTAYGNEVSFILWMNQPGPQVIDADGNSYNSVKLGSQIWMSENLKTTKYKDGSAIPLVTLNATWDTLLTPAYCWFNNNGATFKNMYGALYNWYTIDSGNLCPTGWHVPYDTEWTTLIDYLGGESIAGGKLKETSTAHWFTPNAGATNESGFNALPGGSNFDGGFQGIGDYGFWWSFTIIANNNMGRSMYYSAALVYRNSYSKNFGFSVRCLKD
jgi:uncharacterized protein (TIGR02145 family)